MSSSHNRSSSTRPSRPTQTVAPLDTQRSASVPNRQFIIILTNNPELLRQTRRFQPQIPLDTQRNTTVASNARSNNGATNTNSNHNNREQILDNLFREWQQRFRGGMLAPNVPIHFGVAHTEEHETLLYNTLQFELEECIRAYLQRTQRLYPINLNDQPQQRFQSTFDWPTQLLVKNEAHDTALDEQFIAKLRQLIYEYMQHTTRPLPLKYFLDLTEE
ncbi:unnamed protein product [Rotaria sp. Silwood1]|nr:unnamed protein product [Rotaria sp. Silwood1]CAF5005439.1 unnamed protein product [Rotaria sp. Silwood1]